MSAKTKVVTSATWLQTLALCELFLQLAKARLSAKTRAFAGDAICPASDGFAILTGHDAKRNAKKSGVKKISGAQTLGVKENLADFAR